MPISEITQKILEAANKAYEGGECRIDEDIPAGERGDGLANFIRQEIIEVTEGAINIETAKKIAIINLARAKEQLGKVFYHLYKQIIW